MQHTQVLINEICHELLLDAAIDTFEAAEQAAKKKELPSDQLKVVHDALHNGPADRVLIQKYNVDITRRLLQCLHPLQWLNDEVACCSSIVWSCWRLQRADHSCLGVHA